MLFLILPPPSVCVNVTDFSRSSYRWNHTVSVPLGFDWDCIESTDDFVCPEHPTEYIFAHESGDFFGRDPQKWICAFLGLDKLFSKRCPPRLASRPTLPTTKANMLI